MKWENFVDLPIGDNFTALHESDMLDLPSKIADGIPTKKQFKRRAMGNYVKMKVGNFGKAITFQPRTPVTRNRVIAKTAGDYASDIFK